MWAVDGYYWYALTIFVISVVTIIITLVEMMSNNRRVRRMALYSCDVKLRVLDKTGGYTLKEVISSELVPGDIIEIPEGKVLPCDLVLFTGNAIANEAMLTGESIPVLKTSLPLSEEKYDPEKTTKHTLYGGTSIIQTRSNGDGPVFGLVTRTGFLTMKGGLVRDILYPKEIAFAFYR